MTAALEAGYRHIDTAQMYGNEAGVGEAIARLRAAARRALRHHQAQQRLPPARRRPPRVRRVARPARARPGRPVPHPLAAADPVRRRLRVHLADPRRARRRRPGDARSASRTSSPPTSTGSSTRPAWCPSSTRSRCHPFFAQRGGPRRQRAARRRDRGLVADRAGRGRGRRRDRQDRRRLLAGRRPRSSLRWHVQRGDIVFPKTTPPGADAGELRPLRLRAQRRPDGGDRRPRPRRGRAARARTRTCSTRSPPEWGVTQQRRIAPRPGTPPVPDSSALWANSRVQPFRRGTSTEPTADVFPRRHPAAPPAAVGGVAVVHGHRPAHGSDVGRGRVHAELDLPGASVLDGHLARLEAWSPRACSAGPRSWRPTRARRPRSRARASRWRHRSRGGCGRCGAT